MYRLPTKRLPLPVRNYHLSPSFTTSRNTSTTTKQPDPTKPKSTESNVTNPEQQHEKNAQKAAATQQSTQTKTQAQLDEELRQKMSGLAGDGGESGVEYEDGQPTAMKRSVRNNMFRYI